MATEAAMSHALMKAPKTIVSKMMPKLVLLLVCAFAYGHDSPNEVIDALSHRIESEGATAALLVSRAYEYRAYGDMEAAETDLLAALVLDDGNGPAYVSLGQLYIYQEKNTKAVEVVDAALGKVEQREFRASLHALAAEAFFSLKDFGRSLEEVGMALEISPAELEWILLKSRILGEFGRHDERAAFVREASRKNASVVLQIELVNTLRDAKRFAECLKLIDAYVEKRRWKAEWLLRRAEVFQAMGDSASMKADAQRAFDEIEGRLKLTEKPDSVLLDERARAYGFLDKQGERRSLDDDEDDIGGVVSSTVLDVDVHF